MLVSPCTLIRLFRPPLAAARKESSFLLLDLPCLCACRERSLTDNKRVLIRS